jgi:hypothetical protein
MYAPYLNQFIQPDTIVPDPRTPQAWNRYSYSLNNPINFTDPLGLCANCYVFFFPGAGNHGDTNHNGKMDDDDLGAGERLMVQDLRSRTGAVVTPIYPYGSGIGGDRVKNNITEAIIPSMKQESYIPRFKAEEIAARLLGDDIFLCHDNDYGKGQFDNNILNVTFVGYSGGGQMAYSTAQSLSGKLVVDNLILFGATVYHHNGMGNIGAIWSFVGTQDVFVPVIRGAWSLYSGNWTSCQLFGDDDSPYIHYGEGDYFDVRPGKFQGLSCTGRHSEQSVSKEVASQLGFSHYEANMALLVAIVNGVLK